MQTAVTPESVVQFLNDFEEVALKEDFDLLEDMIDERAFFRFSDGDFRGRAAIRAVFEKTWRGDPSVKKARFYLSDIDVLILDSVQVETNYPRPSRQTSQSLSARSKPREPCLKLVDDA